MLQEFYQIAFRKKMYRSIDKLQADLDEWLKSYTCERPHRGRYCYGVSVPRSPSPRGIRVCIGQ